MFQPGDRVRVKAMDTTYHDGVGTVLHHEPWPNFGLEWAVRLDGRPDNSLIRFRTHELCRA